MELRVREINDRSSWTRMENGNPHIGLLCVLSRHRIKIGKKQGTHESSCFTGIGASERFQQLKMSEDETCY